MKGFAGLIVTVLVLALIGFAALEVGRYERRMADSQQNLATLQYEDATQELADAGRYAEYAAWVPGLGDRVQHDLRARQAALNYWQHKYDEVLPRDSDPVGAVDASNPELQLVVANAAFRAGQAGATDRETTLQALDEAVGSYLAVLKGEEWNEDAAYNYEYLVRLRDEFSRTKKAPPPPPNQEKSTSNGQSGAPQQTADSKKFEIYVPLESSERNKAAEAGKSTPNKRKG